MSELDNYIPCVLCGEFCKFDKYLEHIKYCDVEVEVEDNESETNSETHPNVDSLYHQISEGLQDRINNTFTKLNEIRSFIDSTSQNTTTFNGINIISENQSQQQSQQQTQTVEQQQYLNNTIFSVFYNLFKNFKIACDYQFSRSHIIKKF